MSKGFFIFLSLLFCGSVYAQKKVANYFTGEYGTKSYEHFSFWVETGKPLSVQYSYGEKPKDISLTLLGKQKLNGQTVFKLQFSNQYVLYIAAEKEQLHVTDAAGRYNKIFTWEYEGPVNGVGTFCDVCAEDEAEAMAIMEQGYLQ